MLKCRTYRSSPYEDEAWEESRWWWYGVKEGPGHILSQGSLDNVLKHNSHLVKEVIEEREELEKAKREIDVEKPEDAVVKQTVGKLVVAEEMEDGHVGWSARTFSINIYSGCTPADVSLQSSCISVIRRADRRCFGLFMSPPTSCITSSSMLR